MYSSMASLKLSLSSGRLRSWQRCPSHFLYSLRAKNETRNKEKDIYFYGLLRRRGLFENTTLCPPSSQPTDLKICLPAKILFRHIFLQKLLTCRLFGPLGSKLSAIVCRKPLAEVSLVNNSFNLFTCWVIKIKRILPATGWTFKKLTVDKAKRIYI